MTSSPLGQNPAPIAITHNRPLRALLVTLGVLLVIVGVIGLFLPLLPTTPFLLLAAGCFARSSPTFYQALTTHPIVGPPIRQWREDRTIPLRAKWIAVIMIALTLGSSILFIVPLISVKIGLTVLGLGIVIWILRIPTRTVHEGE